MPDEYRKQFRTSDEAYESTYELSDRDPRVEVYQEDDYWYVEKLLPEAVIVPDPRPLTTDERRLILRGMSALKKEVHPTEPDWNKIERLRDAILTRKV